MNEGYRWKKKLFSQQGRALLEKLSLAPWASRRRKELLELLDQLDPKIAELTAAVEHEAKKRPEVVQLMTHPGVGPITGLAYMPWFLEVVLASFRSGRSARSHNNARG